MLIFAPTPRGGLAEHVHYQARELARRGFAVTVLCRPEFAKADPAYRRAESLRSATGTGLAARLARAALRIADYYVLAAATIRDRPAFVLMEANSEYFSPAWFLPHWLLRRRGTIYLANFHDPLRKRRFGPAWWHALTVRLGYAPLAGGLIHGPAPPGAYLPLRLIIREAPFGPFADLAGRPAPFDLRARLGIPREAFVLLAFGHVADRKNLDLVIDALAGQHQAHLVVAGRPGSSADRALAFYAGRARQAEVAARVHFVDAFIPDSDVPAYFAAADAIALTYAREFVSQSGVLQIAALFDKPLLASGGEGPLPATVRGYDLGVVVEPDSARAIAAGLERLIAEPRDLSGNFARYRASTSWEVNVDRLLEVVAAVKASRSA
jgi:glycosyltransferase involved in cell wall biosynthesis